MNKPILTAALFACAIFAAQAAEPYSDCDSVRFEDFRHIDLNDFEPTTYPYTFIQPSHLQIVNDSTLAYADAGSSPMVKVINPEKGSCLAYINAGFGDFDMSSIQTVSFTDSILSVFDGRSKHFAEFKYKSGLEFTPVGWMTTSGSVSRIVRTDENHCIWTGNSSSDKLFHSVDLTTGEITDFGDIPLVPHDEDAEPDEYIMQGLIDFDPNTRRLVSSILSWDIVSIYDADSLRLIKRFRGPLYVDSRVVLNKYKSGVTTKWMRPFVTAANRLHHSKSGFSIGLCGVDEQLLQYYNRITAVASYSWDGEPLILIRFPEPTIDFAYDLDRNLLFLMTVDYDGIIRLKKYDLKKQQS